VGAQGGGTPSVRVEVNPTKLESFGLTLGSVQSVLSLQNSHLPRGQLADNGVSEDILTNDQISTAADYRPLIVGYHNGQCNQAFRCGRRRGFEHRTFAPPATSTEPGGWCSPSSVSPGRTLLRPSISVSAIDVFPKL